MKNAKPNRNTRWRELSVGRAVRAPQGSQGWNGADHPCVFDPAEQAPVASTHPFRSSCPRRLRTFPRPRLSARTESPVDALQEQPRVGAELGLGGAHFLEVVKMKEVVLCELGVGFAGSSAPTAFGRGIDVATSLLAGEPDAIGHRDRYDSVESFGRVERRRPTRFLR